MIFLPLFVTFLCHFFTFKKKNQHLLSTAVVQTDEGGQAKRRFFAGPAVAEAMAGESGDSRIDFIDPISEQGQNSRPNELLLVR
jgi:hypothetical protein